jgi:hypothetical protein
VGSPQFLFYPVKDDGRAKAPLARRDRAATVREPRAQSQPDRRRFHRRCSSRGTRVAMPHQTNPIRGGADLLVCVLPAFPKKTKRTQSRLQRSATHRPARSRTPAPNKPILRTTKTKGTTCTVHQTNPIASTRLPVHPLPCPTQSPKRAWPAAAPPHFSLDSQSQFAIL